MLEELYSRIAEKTGRSPLSAGESAIGESLAAELLENKGSSIVLGGANDPYVQDLIAGINHMLGSYGKTLDTGRTIQLRQGENVKMEKVLAALEADELSTLIFWNVNPVYSHPKGEKLAEGLKKASLSIYMGSAFNETAAYFV